MRKNKKHLNISNARVPEQLKQMEALEKKGICPFCRKHFEANHREPILREGKDWIISKNDYPYKGTRIHLLFIYKKHINAAAKISRAGAVELLGHIKWAEKKFKIPGASFFMRSGDNEYTGATITHLHAHMVIGKRRNKKSKPIVTVLGWK